MRGGTTVPVSRLRNQTKNKKGSITLAVTLTMQKHVP